jgi:hypothetical protein
MPRPALATVADVEARLGRTVDDETQVQAWLEDASAIARAYAGKTWLNADETALSGEPADVVGVVAGMVVRLINNPDGVTQETLGQFSQSFGTDAAQRLFLTATDKLVLKAASGRTGIGTLPTTRGHLETPQVRERFLWCGDDDDDCPWLEDCIVLDDCETTGS